LAVVGPDLLALRSPTRLEPSGDGSAAAEFDVAAGQTLSFVLCHGPSHLSPPAGMDPGKALEQTLSFWRGWAGRFKRETPWREPVIRSLLTLKALSYHPTGALVAAATTSLPEVPGGNLNWDYRYCWLRDATFTVGALLNAGYHEESVAWRDWMLRAIANVPDQMRIMYRVDGGRRINEWTVDWLPGYHGARPVRGGNNAADQRQTDVVGELLDALDLISQAGVPSTPESLESECELMRHLEANWQKKGHGLWESRGAPERYTYPVVMSWVGVDRFIRGCERRGYADGVDLTHLRGLRDRIRSDILTGSWHHQRGHFVDRYGGERLDASLLLLPLVNFLPVDDPRMSATIDAIERELSHDGLVWRTPHDGDANQGAFIPCTCWLADCRGMQGRREEAVRLLERVLAMRNDVGLLSEEFHAGLNCQMGNFPQALSHLALINTALGLSGPVLQRGGG
jgi:GH15 family glucan-1,4-alpha-glucosidase